MNRDNHPTYYLDGRCTHCGDKCDTFGCARCKQVQTFCTCGALIMCGCGRSFVHENCPNVIQTSFVRLTATYKIIPSGVPPIGEFTYQTLFPPTTTPVHLMPDFDQQRLSFHLPGSSPVFHFNY